MGANSRIRVRHGTTLEQNEARAVEAIHEQVHQDGAYDVLFFCSASYDLERLASLLRATFPRVVVGCTSSGQLGPAGFQRGGITAVSLSSHELAVTPFPIRELDAASFQAAHVAAGIRARRECRPDGRRAFGLLLIDGLSLAEERVAAALYQALGDVPFIGGSAGDDLGFAATHVFIDGEFTSGAATFVLFETSLPFQLFKFQHFLPRDEILVITGADPAARVVTEINGEPAAQAYAAMVGCPVESLDGTVFSAFPVLLRVGDDHYVRSIQKVNPDGSLTFYCAIEKGLVLRLGRSVDVLGTIDQAFKGASDVHPEIILGCDCILRRLEFEARGLDQRVGELMVAHRVFGFSTYGEQFNALHVNQTFTGVAIGG